MREIKFRAWDQKHEIMIPFTDNYICDEYSGIIFVTPNDHSFSGIGRLPGSYKDSKDGETYTARYELMQYTGLKDKNGVEIYEGDIVVSVHDEKEGTDTCVVEWESGLAGWLLDTRFPGSLGTYQLNSYVSGLYKIIGNIYENPELLEKED